MNLPYEIEVGIGPHPGDKGHQPYTFVILERDNIRIPGRMEDVEVRQGVKVFRDGYVKCEHVQQKCEKASELFDILKVLSIEDRLEYIKNLVDDLNSIKKFKL